MKKTFICVASVALLNACAPEAPNSNISSVSAVQPSGVTIENIGKPQEDFFVL